MNKLFLIGILIGTAAGVTIMSLMPSGETSNDSMGQKQPLYWVAPMDPNYRRDEPGLSPMGMDLIPVYEEGTSDSGEGAGTIKIAPNVVNNLGVRTTKATLSTLQPKINTVGYVDYDQDRFIHIHPRIEGWIEKLYVNSTGDSVKKGQALYELYSPQLLNAQEELINALNRNNSILINAAEKRLKSLQLSTAFISRLKKDLEIRQTVVFYSPQSGVIANLNIREGYFVKPDKTLMSIGDLSKVWVDAEIFERQAFLVKENQLVEMKLDYVPGRVWKGTVDYIYPSLEAATRTIRVRLRFDNQDGALKPNMFALISIQAGDDSHRLLIPSESVIRTGSQDRVVLALGDGQFKSVAVKLGKFDETHIEVLDGISEGESVVTSAQFLLDSESSKTSDFARLQPVDQKPVSVWVAADITTVMSDDRMVKARHDPIDAWQWPEMTMNFMVSENVKFEDLKAGLNAHIEISESDDGLYEITGIHIMGESMETMNHSQMNHDNMDEMDHSQMNDEHSKNSSPDSQFKDEVK